MLTTGRQIFIDKAIVYPGDTVRAYVKIISTNYFHKSLTEGMEYEFGLPGGKGVGILVGFCWAKDMRRTPRHMVSRQKKLRIRSGLETR
jgi:hypothetical protein